MTEHTRRVGDRGQVTIPKAVREKWGIEGGDELTITDRGDLLVIEPPADEARLAEGYKQRADRAQRLAEALEPASSEATDQLGDAPTWTE